MSGLTRSRRWSTGYPTARRWGCLVEHSADSRGVIVASSSPEDGPLRYLLGLTMASGLVVYDIELFRLYDARGCVVVEVSLGTDWPKNTS